MIMEENQKRQNKHYIAAFILAAAGVLLDQWSKYLAVTYLKDKNPIDLIPGIFQLTYLENRGAAFGILQGKQWFFYISTFLVMGAVIWIYMKIPASKKVPASSDLRYFDRFRGNRQFDRSHPAAVCD